MIGGVLSTTVQDPSFAVPDSDGASSILNRQEEDALWEMSFTGVLTRGRVFEPSSKQPEPCRVRYGLNPKTVAKWRKRPTTADTPMGPKAKSTVLTPGEEAIVVRRQSFQT